MIASPLSPHNATTQLTTFKSYVALIADPTPGIAEKKLKAAQELSENFETVVSSPQYPQFLADAVRVFMKILEDGEPQFIADQNLQQLRKLLLEIIHRIPSNEHLKKYVQQILSLMFKLIKVENEENVLVCLKIIIELHKQYRPQMNEEIQDFLKFVNQIYTNLPTHLNKIFEPRSQIKVKDVAEINVDALLQETYTVTTIMTDKKNADNQSVSYNIIPKGVLSLKVLAELPIIVVLMYQLYKPNVHQEVANFIPLIMNTIILQPLQQHRSHPAFNKEVFVDFVAAQIKTLSFLAYIVRIFQEQVQNYSQKMVQGHLSLLSLCPQEVAHLRKELLIAAKHILATDLRNKFVSVIDKLFDESILIGNGWTTYESLRPLAYSTLADLVHHVRQALPMTELSMAVNLFSKNVHDESLLSSIQTMSCKLLLNLVDCIRQKSEQENGNGRELLMRMLEVFVLKFKTIAKIQLPQILSKCQKQPNQTSTDPSKPGEVKTPPATTPTVSNPPTTPGVVPETPTTSDVKPPLGSVSTDIKDTNSSKDNDKPQNRFGVTPSQYNTYSVADCRGLVKTLVCGVKTITWGIVSCKATGTDVTDTSLVQNKQFLPKETLVYVRLVRYALQALDIYTINVSPSGQAVVRPAVVQTVRTKEEKEVLEHFAGVFTMMSPFTFKEIFATTIEFMVDRIHNNYALQIVANTFLANPSTSATFATILVEYLLARLEEMGSNMERSNLYLKLFKLVFGSVSLFANENEQMLKPHLHTIVNRSMELAMSAKEPYNYFLLLRALFRSIGGGSHDLLYQEFLPLLPNLLQGLNSLQSGLHRQHMKDLFVELCLTVPVRLSSLLPYLPMLMDPLVSALNGSQTLVSQGLRTLELCVDNLQPDFLYDHIQPVRAELMQALWRTLRNPVDNIAHVAFRVLGKFGGGNRKMLREPQTLQFNDKETVGPCISIYFQDCKTPISLPVEKAIDAALTALKCSSTDTYYRRQAWELIKCFLVSVMNLEDDKPTLDNLFNHPSFAEKEIPAQNNQLYKNPDAHSRKVHEQALTGMFVAAAIKELRQSALRFMGCMVRHYTMIAISQQCGPFPVGERQNKLQGMDTQILIDALAVIMGHEEKELCKPGNLALVLILDTATTILGSKEKACQLPLFEYLVEKMCSLCYDRAWYAKFGGCLAIKSMNERMALRWVLEHQFHFLKALFFVMMDLTGEVSSGAVDLAKSNLDSMLTMCARKLEGENASEEMLYVQKKSFHDVTYELVRQVTSPNTTVRETAMKSLETLAQVTGQSVTAIMEPHKEVLQDMIPPKKHLLRHQPANAQIGLMDGNTFCTSLNPRLFTIDLSITEHNVYFSELQNLCDAEDSVLLKLPCYKSVTNLLPLRKSALRALAACSYISTKREKIFQVLYKALNSKTSELQEVAHDCMKKFIASGHIEMEIVHGAMRPLLLMLGDYRNLDLNVIQRLSSLTQLFPNTFNEKLCEQLLTHLRKWLEIAQQSQKSGQVRATGQELKICAAIINIFHLIPAASKKMIEPLLKVALLGEKSLLMEPGSPFREPLRKFLVRYPVQTVDYLMNDTNIRDMQYLRYFVYLLGHKDGQPFRDVMKTQVLKLVSMLTGNAQAQLTLTINQHQQSVTPAARGELEYQGIVLTHTLIRHEDEWLSNHPQLVTCLKKIWVTDEFQADKSVQDITDYTHWKVPSLVVKCLLNYFKHNVNEIELLFHILRCFTSRHVPQYQFVKDFLDNTVAASYSVDWKRKAFFRFVEVFHDASWNQILKAKIIQYVLLPCFQQSFESGDGEKLIGGPAQPDQDNPDNIVSVFINKVIDPENPFGNSDAVRILLLQFSSLLVEQAAPHVHDAANKKQGNKLRRLMTFAWPCLLMKNCIDPATKYHGHLLLSHIIAKFAIHKRIVLQVFHSLLKAHAVEARAVVRQALEILTPAMPGRMEDGNGMLTHWTKKIIVEDGHSVAQLVHILQLVVRHFKVYYPVRHHLIQHMVNSLQRLGFTQSATIEHRKLAVDLAEVIIKWEIQRIKEDNDPADGSGDATPGSVKRAGSVDPPGEVKKARYSSGAVGSPDPATKSIESSKPIEKQYCDAVVNFLLRIACQVSEVAGSPGEVLSRRCVALLKMALRPDVWPNTELKLAWFDKLLNTVESQQPNFNNICTALELLCFLLTILKKEQILASFKPLQRGIAACMNCPNTKVIRGVHSLLSRLMSFFPTEPVNSNVASKYEELECLYACVSKVVYEGLTNYDKATNGSTSQLFSTLMILKAACIHNQCYIDRLITTFMKVLTKMAREHLQPSTTEASPVASELLILSLDLVKNRVVVMSMEMRKSFIGQILVGLIEKTPDSKVMKAITKMVEDWVKTKGTIALNQSPSIREKAILLVKLMVHIEKRFSDDQELNAQFLELVIYIYRDEGLSGTELTTKLEQAFLAGLRCQQPLIRGKFVEVFNSSIPRRVFERLLYITCSQNWELMGGHFWIKQCIELLMSVAVNGHTIQSSSSLNLLPSASSIVSLADSQDRAHFATIMKMKEEPMDIETLDSNKEDDEIDIELGVASDETTQKESPKKEIQDPKQNLQTLLQRQAKFLENCREVKTVQYLGALSQLCHSSTDLSHISWMDLYPRIWKVLSEKQQQMLGAELVPFMCSGSHVVQKDCHPSAIHTFVESLALCVPPVPIRPSILKYLGRTHNLWYRSCLLLEQIAFDNAPSGLVKRGGASEYEFEPSGSNAPGQETLDGLCDLYSLLKEEDMWAGLWQKRAKFAETNTAIAYEQHGFFEQSQSSYEAAMAKARSDHNAGAASPSIIPEYRLWEDHWIRCSKELNQWDHLLEYANSKGNTNPHLVLESAWRVPNWALMKDALSQVELSCPKEMAWKVNLYRGYIAICHPDDHHLNMVTMIERLVELSSNLAIKEWRRLPHIVTHIHVPLLQAAQQIMELQEAAQINQGLQPANITRSTSLHDMKAIVKTWRNRLPMISDDLSHWSDIFTWRQHHYQFIVNHYDTHAAQDQQNNHSMLGVHASAQAIIHFGKIARKHNLSGVCLDSLSRIHTIPSVPIVDCFQKIRQQVKCYLQMAGSMGKPELNEGLEVIESTNLKYFTKEMTAEFYALKGMFLAQTGRSDDANKSFSAAVQMHDTLVKAWALWGDYLESVFTRDKQINLGVSAITCFLHACRHQNESKSRKYLAKVLWLLTYDDEKSTLAEAVDKYCVGVPPVQWLPWIPQLLTCLVRNEGRLIMNLLSQVGRMYPQAVYFPIRTLYLTLKIEQRERYKSGEMTLSRSNSQVATTTSSGSSGQIMSPTTPGLVVPTTPEPTLSVSDPTSSAPTTSSTTPTTSSSGSSSGRGSSQSDAGPIRAPAPMWRCSRIMHMQRELHPTILSSLEGIVDQMVWFRENWYEEVLRQLRQGLAKCYAVAFENRASVADATITPHTLNFVKKLVSTFGVGIENVSNVVTTFSSAASESLARRAQATAQDPIFQKMKSQFTTDFDFSVPGSTKLHNLINKLKKWIKILEAKTKLLPKSFLIEEKCRFLSNFSNNTAEVELPGEFLLPKHSHYYVRIARFMPRVEIVQKHNTAARRLYIRGHNGKIYPYLVVNDACLTESRREERVLQLLRMLNHFLTKQKETSRRMLYFTVPRVVAVSPQMRLVEDNPASVSLLDVYKQRCNKRGIEHDAPIARYYERLLTVQARGTQASHQVLRDILKEVQNNMVPRGLLKEWALHTFLDATDYWIFRKTFTVQLALMGFAEFVLHLTRMNPDMMYLHQDCGYINISYFKFDIDDQSGDLDANRPVPFRLTPNIAEFLTSTGVTGPLTASMISTARCFVQPQYKLPSFLRAILRDEYITWHKKKQEEVNPGTEPSEMEGEQLITMVNKAVSAITTRLQNLATFEGAESRVNTLVAAANSHDNLCRMDPAWHPWL
ncbi:transformation/transcription domain-associated protein-like isoform X1 [Mercenaria mercenaria]|uniref:transformation/transcription domain-associated protein-like isoform X1 n=1 Tax=Mercenaria mercenaria TaxID=6596 RepID=UPI00234F66DC|nr:transformation/transcription domain-associated protein-like isoform X1 [Mercenaria mercenaria]